MKLQLQRAQPCGGKTLPKGTILIGAAAEYVWAHPMLKQNVAVIPESVLDSHHAPSAPPISELPPEFAKRAAAKKKPSTAVPPAVPVALTAATPAKPAAPAAPVAAAATPVTPPAAASPVPAVAAPKTGV